MVSGLQVQTAWRLADTFAKAKSMRANARREKIMQSAHWKRSREPYLQSPEMYFHAHCDHSLPHANVSSETARRTHRTPKAIESHHQARTARCTCSSITNGSAAIRCAAGPTRAQTLRRLSQPPQHEAK